MVTATANLSLSHSWYRGLYPFIHLTCMVSYRIIFPLIEADISVEDFNEKLDLQRWVHALVGNLQSFL